MKIGDTVILRGISRHGKNRIAEHGEAYVIKKIDFFPHNDRLLLKNDTDIRWIYTQRDSHFEIVGEVK